MSEERNDGLLPEGQDAVMVYINPQLIQSLADVSARKEQSFRELLEAAEDGDLDAQYRVAMNYCNGTGGTQRDEALAFHWFTRAAEGDYIAAQYGLGMCFGRGIGTEKDPERAVQLFTQAAEQGYPPAMCELGLCYELGSGVEMDKERAAELYREAAEQDHAPSQCNLGFFYYRGIGVEQDYEEAAAWFAKAAPVSYTHLTLPTS